MSTTGPLGPEDLEPDDGPQGSVTERNGGYGRPAPRPRARSHRVARRRWSAVVAAVVVVVVLVLLGGFFWVQHEATPGGPPGVQVLTTVPSGTGASQLSATLAAKGVITSSLAYRIWSQFHGSPPVLSGVYAFNKNSSFAAVDQVISAGPNVFPRTFPRGSPWPRWPVGWASYPGTRRPALPVSPPAGRSVPRGSPPARTTSTGSSAPASTSSCPARPTPGSSP